MLKNYLHKEKIRVRNFMLILMLSLLPLSLLGFLSFHVTKDLLIKNQSETIESHLETSSEVADLLFRNIINVERIITWNRSVQKELKSSASTEMVGGKLVDTSAIARLQDYISSSLIDTQDIDSVCIMNTRFQSACYGNSESYVGFGGGKSFGELEKTDWYKATVNNDGKPTFFGYNVLLGDKATKTFSSTKLLKDPDDFYDPETTGLLIVNVKKTMFNRVYKENSDDSVFAVHEPNSNHWQTVYFSPNQQGVSADLLSTLQTSTEQWRKEGYLVTTVKNHTTGWTFSHIMQEEKLLEQSNQIRSLTILLASIIAFFALLCSFLLSESISNPLVMLKQLALEWRSSKNTEADEDKTDGIELIGQTFRQIAVENKELNEELMRTQLREREAELRALQAQIKPHFLYNTLDSMYWMAILENNEEIAKMAVALSETFKLSLNNGNDMILVSQELDHIRHYMTIQNLRFNKRFSIEVDVKNELLNQEILKLILQPFVENAIYHGLEPKQGTGSVRLTGTLEDGWTIFTIEDDGVGMENLDRVFQGYGIQNVRERLLLCYGSESQLKITSKVNEGTKVEIRFRERGTSLC